MKKVRATEILDYYDGVLLFEGRCFHGGAPLVMDLEPQGGPMPESELPPAGDVEDACTNTTAVRQKMSLSARSALSGRDRRLAMSGGGGAICARVWMPAIRLRRMNAAGNWMRVMAVSGEQGGTRRAAGRG